MTPRLRNLALDGERSRPASYQKDHLQGRAQPRQQGCASLRQPAQSNRAQNPVRRRRAAPGREHERRPGDQSSSPAHGRQQRLRHR